MQMLEGVEREDALRVLRDADKKEVAQFVKALGEHARDAVAHNQKDWHDYFWWNRAALLGRKRIDRTFIEKRYIDIDQFGEYKAEQRQNDAHS